MINEKINYSSYEPNKKIKVKKYIGENTQGIELLFKDTKISLVIAGTGSGKTYTILNFIKKLIQKGKIILKNEANEEKEINKIIFVVPNATQVGQIQKQFNIYGAWGNINPNKIFKENNIICCTWDKFGEIKEDLTQTMVILDEIHQIYIDMYRKEKIDKLYKNLSKCCKRIDITATPNKLDFLKYETIVEYEQKIKTKYKVKLYKKINDNKILEIISKSKKFALFRDNKKYLESIKRTSNKNCAVLDADSKLNSLHLEIIQNSTIGYIQGLLNTSVITAGINVYDKDITDIIIIGIKDIATIKQYVARFRDLKTVRVHIFNNFLKDVSTVENIEKEINDEIQITKANCKYYNKKRKNNKLAYKVCSKTNKINNVYIEDNTYIVDEIAIRSKFYKTYYGYAGFENFGELLKEYFEDIELIDCEEASNKEIKENSKEIKKEAKELKEAIEVHKDYLVDVYNILDNKISFETLEYLNNNNLSPKDIEKYINNKKLNELLNNSDIKKYLEGYTDLVLKMGYTNNIAWTLQGFSENKRRAFIEKIRLIKFINALNNPNIKDFIDTEALGNIEYIELIKKFKIGDYYIVEEHSTEELEIIYYNKNNNQKLKEKAELLISANSLESFSKKLYQNEKIKLSTVELSRKIRNIYKVETLRIQLKQEKKEIRLRIYKIKELQNINSICKEYGFLDNRDIENLKALINKTEVNLLEQINKIQTIEAKSKNNECVTPKHKQIQISFK